MIVADDSGEGLAFAQASCLGSLFGPLDRIVGAGRPCVTFVIDAGGRVADVIPKVSPKTHDEQVLKILGSM